MSKPLRIGFAPIRNEEKCIRGWVDCLSHFCEDIYALLDPDSSDKTEQILRKDYKDTVKIIYQDRSLGDSDYGIQGPNKSLIMHNNITKFVRENIDIGEWFMMLAADERISSESIPILLNDLDYAKTHECGAICHERLYEVIPIHHDNILHNTKNSTYTIKDLNDPLIPDLMNYVIDFGKSTLRHCRIDCRTPKWMKKPTPHSGYSERYNSLITHVPLWHFHRVKHNQITPTDWRDGMGGLDKLFERSKGHPPIMQMRIPFADWQNNIGADYQIIDNVKRANLLSKKVYLDRLSNEIDWDAWRLNYDNMNFNDMQKFYNEAAKTVTEQNCYNPALSVFLREIEGPINVYEFGGWKGELADDVLSEKDDIECWFNFDISEYAIKNSVCKTSNYVPILLDSFLWNKDIWLTAGKRVLVASHSFEHIKSWQIAKMIIKIEPDMICMDTPHGNWLGYNGSHILSLSKVQLDELICNLGYKKIYEFENVRCFQKEWK